MESPIEKGTTIYINGKKLTVVDSKVNSAGGLFLHLAPEVKFIQVDIGLGPDVTGIVEAMKVDKGIHIFDSHTYKGFPSPGLGISDHIQIPHITREMWDAVVPKIDKPSFTPKQVLMSSTPTSSVNYLKEIWDNALSRDAFDLDIMKSLRGDFKIEDNLNKEE